MRTGAAAQHSGYFHETAFYRSDQEFLDLLLPFFTDGLAAGEPTVAAFAPANQQLLRDALGTRSGVRFIDGEAQYLRPAAAIRRYRDILAEYVADGATQIRVAGDVPHPGVGAPWDWWARYEAAVNHAYDEFPIWGICPYDTRTTPGYVLQDVRRTHPHIATADGHHTNDAFEDPVDFLSSTTGHWQDPLERTPPAVELHDPSPSQVRAALTRLAAATRLDPEDVNGLLLAASEAATNATVHGVSPVQVRMWAVPRRVVIAVTDHGPGPTDPFAGLLPVTGPQTGGYGLWLTHQVCAFVALQHEPDRFTIHLIGGDLPA